MKVNWHKLFTLSVSDSKYFDDERVKFEYTGCNVSKKSCLNYLPKINNCFRKSDIFYTDKEFDQSLESLEKAYVIARKIKEPACLNCALFFKATVIQSIKNIYNELGNMSKGLFAIRRYQPSFVKADELLKNIKYANKVNTHLFPDYRHLSSRTSLYSKYSSSQDVAIMNLHI